MISYPSTRSPRIIDRMRSRAGTCRALELGLKQFRDVGDDDSLIRIVGGEEIDLVRRPALSDSEERVSIPGASARIKSDLSSFSTAMSDRLRKGERSVSGNSILVSRSIKMETGRAFPSGGTTCKYQIGALRIWERSSEKDAGAMRLELELRRQAYFLLAFFAAQ